MSRHQPFQVIGYHSCDKEVGLRVLNGQDQLKPSNNNWDWLGGGVYFWEQNPTRALGYANDVSSGKQFNKTTIKVPFVLGAIIKLGNCLNLVESESINIMQEAYLGLEDSLKKAGKKMPVNKDSKRELDCAVMRYVHHSRAELGKPQYDSIRSPFDEGEKAYPGATFTARSHIQICVINTDLIAGYFLPTPIKEFNPHL